VIKRIRFAPEGPARASDSFAAAWRQLSSMVADAPTEVRPLRIALCTALPEVIPDPIHGAISLEWFGDLSHLHRFTTWLDESAGLPVHQAMEQISEGPLVIADELVLRGADWLEQRWVVGAPKVKHMAIASRAADLTFAEFSERWKDRAGKIQRPGDAQPIVIPDRARGQAYVQNHPQVRETGDWAYDAINEVYFDGVEGLRARAEWFDENLQEQAEQDLVREASFLAVREELLLS
jgi:hypothetical protein